MVHHTCTWGAGNVVLMVSCGGRVLEVVMAGRRAVEAFVSSWDMNLVLRWVRFSVSSFLLFLQFGNVDAGDGRCAQDRPE